MGVDSGAFVRSGTIEYNFEIQQKCRFEVYHTPDPKSEDISEWDFLGSAEVFVGELVSAAGADCEREILHHARKNNGTIHFQAEEMKSLKLQCGFQLSAKSLPVMDFFSRRADPYVVIYRGAVPNLRLSEEEQFKQKVPVFKTETKKRTLNPTWDPEKVSLRRVRSRANILIQICSNDDEQCDLNVQQLCRGDEFRSIIVEVYDWNRTQADKLIGSATTCLADLRRASSDGKPVILALYENIEPAAAGQGKKKKKPKCMGQLIFDAIKIEKSYTFLDYIAGGLEMNLVVAVDCTRSNGDPAHPGSLHHMEEDGTPNDYVMAIRAVCEILQHYDSDKKYPVYGFGAKIPPGYTTTSRCFALNGDFFDPEVDGLEGIVDVYKKTLPIVTLHGPTEFREIIRLAANLAEPYKDPDGDEDMKYFILLILTDGVINDMQDTINEIVRASRFPMSIIIVGVGDEDFSLMDELDADEEPLYSTSENVYMERDIVQFVPFSDFKDRSYLELAMCTLDEVPREVTNYFQKKGIAPGEPPEEMKDMARTQIKVKEVAAAGPYELPKFLIHEKERLIGAAVSQGYQREDVERGVKDGVPSAELSSLIDILNNTEYRVFGNCFKTEWKKRAEAQKEARKRGIDAKKQEAAIPLGQKSIRQSMSQLNLEDSSTMGGLGGTTMGASALTGSGLTKEALENATGSMTRGSHHTAKLGPDGTPIDRDPDAKPKKKKKKKKGDAAAEEEDNLCKVCFENPIDTVILDCGHQVVCQNCSTDIGSLCPLCRNPIARIIRTYQIK
eukprot:g2367.t1